MRSRSFACAAILNIAPTSRSNVVIRPKLSCRVDKNPATAAIIWKHCIASIAQNKNFVSNTFFDDSSDSSDGSDYMETRLKPQDSHGKVLLI